MAEELARISLTLPPEMVQRLDGIIEDWDYASRSEAVRDALRDFFTTYDWETGGHGHHYGTVVLFYDHHLPDIADRLQAVQHEYTDLITAVQHVHVTHEECFETLTVDGSKEDISQLSNRLRSINGVNQVKVVVLGAGGE